MPFLLGPGAKPHRSPLAERRSERIIESGDSEGRTDYRSCGLRRPSLSPRPGQLQRRLSGIHRRTQDTAVGSRQWAMVLRSVIPEAVSSASRYRGPSVKRGVAAIFKELRRRLLDPGSAFAAAHLPGMTVE